MLYANFYHNLGMNVTHIQGNPNEEKSYKRPTDPKWDSHNIEYINAQNWDKATGIGVMLGDNQYRAIDIDKMFCGNQYWADTKEEKEQMFLDFIHICLELLGLPENYSWVIKSGSHNGCRIIIKAEDIQDFNIETISYSPNSKFRTHDELRQSGAWGDEFLRMELRWNDYLVLPPSIHPSGNLYEFYFKKTPNSAPLAVSIDSLNNLLNYFCADDEYIDCNYKGEKIYLARRVKQIEGFSSRYWNGVLRKTIEDDYNWLSKCYSSIAINTLGVAYALGKGVQANIVKAKSCFERANNPHAHFNLANLIACGCLDGDIEEVNKHLTFCQEIPHEYKQLAEINAKKKLKIKRVPHYLFFDTETTGIPANYNAPMSDLKNWPRLVQIAWIACDEKGVVIESAEHIIQPNGFVIPKDATALHGISTEKAMREGKDLKGVLVPFAKLAKESKFLVGHNISFDINIVGAELIRTGVECVVQNKSSICTMKSTVNFCVLPGKFGYKWATLEELYFKLFGKSFLDAHSAMNDIKATKDCFFELKKLNII